MDFLVSVSVSDLHPMLVVNAIMGLVTNKSAMFIMMLDQLSVLL